VLIVGRQLSSDDVVLAVVFLVEVEQLSDSVGSLGSKSSVDDGVGEAGDFAGTLSDDNGRDDTHIVVDNASTHALSLPLTSSARSVAAHALLQQKSDTSVLKDTLLHAESLLVLATSDPQDVSLEFIAKSIGGNLVRDSLLEHMADFVLIVNFDGFLLARGRIGDVYFHCVWAGYFFVSIFLLSVSST